MDRLLRTLVVVALAAALLPAAAPPAAASECLPAGGVRIPHAPAPEADFAIVGKGWGHGVGLSQYGAQGAALLGCSAATILKTYYPGVRVARDPGTAGTPIRVGLTFGSVTSNRVGALDVDAVAGSLPWRLCRPSGGCEVVADQPQGARWTARVRANGSYRLSDAAGRRVWVGGTNVDVLRLELSPATGGGRVARLPGKGRSYRWGALELDSVVSGSDATAYVTAVVPSIELYLRGLAEMPSSWQDTALRAQAIVGRAYALDRLRNVGLQATCRCHLYDSVAHQAYSGYDKESEGANAYYGRRWVAAVTATAGRIIRNGDRIAVGFYSSSHGGHSESGAFTWGTDTSYLRPVDDSRWELASGNAIRTWAVGLSAAEMGRIFGVGTATSVTRPRPRGAAGRVGDPAKGYGGVVVTGTTGTVRMSGAQFRVKVNAAYGYERVRSTMFKVVRGKPVDPCAAPAGADFSGTRRVGSADPALGAVGASRSSWQQSRVVLVGTAPGWRSALGSAALAARHGGPLLLTGRHDLPAPTKAEIARLGARRVFLLGGRSTISPAVAAELDAMRGVRVTRLNARTRYAQAAKVALAAGPSTDGRGRVTLVAADAADAAQVHGFATAAAAMAATPARVPTLLTRRGELPEPTRRALAGLRARTVLLLGDRTLIAPSVAAALREAGYRVERIAEPNRYRASAETARRSLRALDRPTSVVAASYKRPAELQVAGALAARRNAVLVLAASCDLDDTTSVRDMLTASRGSLSRATVVGPPKVIGERVRWQIGRAIRG